MAMRIAAGWAEVTELPSPYVLLYQHSNERGLFWSVLDPERPKQERELLRPDLITTQVEYDYPANRIIFPFGPQLFGISLVSLKRETIATLASDDDIRWAWADPQRANEFLLIVCKRSPTWAQLREQARLGAKSINPSPRIKFSDYRLVRVWEGRDHERFRFSKRIMASRVAWNLSKLYCWAEGNFLIAVDLATGKLDYKQLPGFNGVAITPRGEPVVWSRDADGVYAVLSGGLHSLSSRGKYPSFSPRGGFAFIGDSMTLWYANANEEPTCIVEGGEDTRPVVSIPVWSRCGSYVASEINGYRRRVVTAIAKPMERKILIIPHADQFSGLLWVERAKLRLNSAAGV